MTPELEAAALDSAASLGTGHGHPVNKGVPCLNCGEIVPERFCSVCGQLATDFHRPWWDLVATSLGDTFLFDSRVARSIPLLLFRPGRLTRNYLDGQRSRYMPPFRMLLIASLIFFLAVFGLSDRLGWFNQFQLNITPSGGFSFGDSDPAAWPEENLARATEALASAEADLAAAKADPATGPGTLADLEADIREAKSDIDEARADKAGAETLVRSMQTILKPDGKIDREALRRNVIESSGGTNLPESLETSLKWANQAADVYENQDRFGARMREWAPRFSLLLFPILTLLLCLSYAWRRRFFVFDHLVTALHFQTFMYFLATTLLIIGALIPSMAGWLVLVLSVGLFVYLYRQLRVTYTTGRVQALLRSVFLSVAGFTALSSLAVGLVILSFLSA